MIRFGKLRWLVPLVAFLSAAAALPADSVQLRPSMFLEKMRAPVLCDDFVDLGFNDRHKLEFTTLQRPVGSLILRRVEIPVVESCQAQLAQCKDSRCSSVGDRCLGVAYAIGMRLGKDLSRAQRHFDAAAQTGDGWAGRQAAAVTWHMGASERGEAYRRLEALARASDPVAARARGRTLMEGVTPPDRMQAQVWYDKAAQNGDLLGVCAQASLLATAPREKRDDARSFTLFVSVANSGNADALANLGLFYALGRGVPPDLNYAITLHTLAAQAGSVSGRRNLAIALEHGIGVGPDPQRALSLYRSAAAEGDIFSREKLGINPFAIRSGK